MTSAELTAWAERSRAAQELPEVVEDLAVLDRVAALIVVVHGGGGADAS